MVTSGKFRKYDYGLIGNKKKYGSIKPPSYDLKKIRVPVSLHYSSNDWLAHEKVRNFSFTYSFISSSFNICQDTYFFVKTRKKI